MDIKFEWSKQFNPKFQRTMAGVQNSIDMQCMEHLREFCPVGRDEFENAGRLRDSAKIAEPGRIIYTAPFARHDYYAAVDHRNGGNPNASRMWLEVVKAKYTGKIHREVSKITKGAFK